MQQTPRADRTHIAFLGACNVGKSSLMNALTAQNLAVVSEIPGTTTDPVEKAMELLPIGPVQLIDTPGFDDDTILGEVRMQRTIDVLTHTDLAVIVTDCPDEKNDVLIQIETQLKSREIPYLICLNKSDLLPENATIPPSMLSVSAATGKGVHALKEALGKLWQDSRVGKSDVTLFGNFLKSDDIVVLVTPIDAAAPKGRIILPQVQAIRAALDRYAICVVTQPEQLAQVLRAFTKAPRLVVTDSQAIETVAKTVPNNVPLTSFSILFARFKGVLESSMREVQALDTLPEKSRILIAEGCTHHRQCGDIGTEKLPRWIESYTGKTFSFSFSSGNTFPSDLSSYQLIVHCGGCMLNEKEMQSRAARAKSQGVPFTNYGILIAYVHGLFSRSTEVLNHIEKRSDENAFSLSGRSEKTSETI